MMSSERPRRSLKTLSNRLPDAGGDRLASEPEPTVTISMDGPGQADSTPAGSTAGTRKDSSASTLALPGDLAHRAIPTGGPEGYELGQELGRGGMGVVYRARQVRANRDVALKMILRGDHAGSAEIARFRAEADAIARLQHPYIITVYEVGEYGGQPYFSMEYCTGGSLANASAVPPSPHAIAELMLKVVRGVAAAHQAGLVHRDLKPGNILMTAEGEPKIADFGLAKQVGVSAAHLQGELTATGQVLGTPSYMAPEQAGGAKRVGPQADVYALGAILYDLLTGRPPFKGPTPTDTLLLLLTEDPRPLREWKATVPRDLEAICLRCLEKDPARRYPSAGDLAADLSRFLQGEPVLAGQSGLVDRLTGALERVPLHERFASYGSLLVNLAPVMFLPELWIVLVTSKNWPSYLLSVGQLTRAALFVVVLMVHRRGRLAPQGPAERQLWAVWGGYLIACFCFGVSNRITLGPDTAIELQLYPGLACLTALAFISIATSLWGYCAVIGAGFLILAFVMPLNLWWAPLEFGAAWGVVLLLIGFRLRRFSHPNPPLPAR